MIQSQDTADGTPALELRDVVVSFGTTQALQGLSLQARRGQITAVLGPNGAGKTTMIRCCTGLVTPDSGQVRVLGHAAGSPEAFSAFIEPGVGHVLSPAMWDRTRTWFKRHL